MEKNKKIWLSHSGIDILLRCPRCFWLKYNKNIYQPEGIVSRLPDRFDRVIKKYFDKFRRKGELPPIVKEKIEAVLENPFQEKYFYPMGEKYGFWGKLDECFIDSNKKYIPVDFKTSSSDPAGREIYPAYQNQLDEYSLLLEVNNKKTAGFGFIIYFYPEESDNLHNGFPMTIHIQALKTDPRAAEARIRKAINVLEGPLPPPSLTCPFCLWRDAVNKTLSDF